MTAIDGRRRRPWFAALLSVLMIGLGQASAGHVRRGVLIFVSWLVLTPLVVWLAILSGSVWVLFAGALIQLGAGVAIVIDAWRLARSAPPRTARFDRWFTWAGVAIAWLLFGSPVQVAWVHRHVGEAFKVPSESMETTVMSGDWLIASPLAGPPQRGALVTYVKEGNQLIKRVVGLGGDTIAMRRDTLTVNGHVLSEPYAQLAGDDRVDDELSWQQGHTIGVDTATYRPSITNWGPLIVPPNHVFLLGDNRGHSRDSRHYGFIPLDSLRLTPDFVYFSWDGPASQVRWHRIGEKLKH